MTDWWAQLSSSDQTLLLMVLAFALGCGLTYAVVALRAARRSAELEAEIATLAAQADASRQLSDERERIFEDSQQRLEASFSLLSGRALKRNAESFMRLAEERFRRHQQQADNSFGQHQQALNELVKPISETLRKSEAQIRELEKERRTAFSSLEKHLALMTQDQQTLQAETRNLVQALRRPEVRGRWGEMTLRRLVELAGMVDRCDFTEQVSVQGDQGQLRPDMVIHLPDQRDIVVDAKTPLDAYLTAQAASDPQAREAALHQHTRNVQARVKQLADKAYWEQFSTSPDFAVLFIPGEQFLAVALERDGQLLEEALRQRVILATPTSLVALLRAIAFSWRQVAMIENAGEIRRLAETFQKRVGIFSEHVAKLGKALGSSVDHYNRSVGSLERQVLPSARRLTELGVEERREIQVPAAVESPVRRPESAEDMKAADTVSTRAKDTGRD
ncbi:MAG: DNA recombination protein RmuC [Pseudomonadota bacterium]